MKKRTEQEILDKCKEIWTHKYELDFHPPDFSVAIKPDAVGLTVHAMYNPPGLGLKQLMELSRFFETENIEDERFSHPGCDTCDYGSDYGFTLYIKPDQK